MPLSSSATTVSLGWTVRHTSATISRGKLPEVVGLWWTHVVVGLLALGVILGPGLIHRLRYRMRRQ